tara:strand:- start:157 stop:288 length:132 start_codon:yes stop_codon:yes gene_type:complete
MKTWSYLEEYKELKKKIIVSIDKTLRAGDLFLANNWICSKKNF